MPRRAGVWLLLCNDMRRVTALLAAAWLRLSSLQSIAQIYMGKIGKTRWYKVQRMPLLLACRILGTDATMAM